MELEATSCEASERLAKPSKSLRLRSQRFVHVHKLDDSDICLLNLAVLLLASFSGRRVGRAGAFAAGSCLAQHSDRVSVHLQSL